MSIWTWEPARPDTMGTFCGPCQARGLHTMHSPNSPQHLAWDARWAEDPSWWPEGAPERMTFPWSLTS